MNSVAERPQSIDAAARTATVRYVIDSAHARAHFKVRHLMVAFVRGELGTITGELLLDPDDPERSTVHAVIDATEINTRNADRDAHLRSADFLDVATYPTVTFRSAGITAREPGVFDVTGDLTIRGVTRAVTLATELSDEIQAPWGDVRRGITATGRINRKDFGVSWNTVMDAGGVAVGDQVEITIEAELIRQA